MSEIKQREELKAAMEETLEKIRSLPIDSPDREVWVKQWIGLRDAESKMAEIQSKEYIEDRKAEIETRKIEAEAVKAKWDFAGKTVTTAIGSVTWLAITAVVTRYEDEGVLTSFVKNLIGKKFW